MARLHEYQGKALLTEHGIDVPRGRVARSADEARGIAGDLAADRDGSVVMKVQAWVTGRKSKGGVAIVPPGEDVAASAEQLLSLSFGNFPVTEILVEEAIDIRDELFVSLSVDDETRAPVLLLDAQGGTGIEDRAAEVARLPVAVDGGVDGDLVQAVLARSSIDARFHAQLAEAIVKIGQIARAVEARSVEVNPLVTTGDGRVVAADCRMTIDDYAVFRHPELGIEIARELDHPATALERAAYRIEAEDHRGTFYFAQLPTGGERGGRGVGGEGDRGVIGFHGAGGGGSMMSMDAATNAGFTLANFCDTSGNPSVAKVYRAARIILAQPDLVGYFGSGSGVASQEQYHSAYGLAKAFCEMNLSIPAVIRLGGNSEDRAVEILESACKELPATVEAYRKDDTPAFCAERFRMHVDAAPGGSTGGGAQPMTRRVPAFVGADGAYSFPLAGGRVWIDHERCDAETTRLIVEHAAGVLEADERGRPILALAEDEVATKDSELIACEIECARAGKPFVFVDLPIPELDGDLDGGAN